MDVKEVRWAIIQWICLHHDRENWQAVLNMVMNIRVPKNGEEGKLFITCRSVSSWRWLFSMELLVINSYILRVDKGVLTEMNWNTESSSESLAFAAPKGRVHGGGQNTVYIWIDYQLDAIEYLFMYFQLDIFRAYTPIFRSNGCYSILHMQCMVSLV